MSRFEVLPDDASPFLRIGQDAVDLLESVTAVEKAQAVPRCLIWQIDPRTGEPVHGDGRGNPTAPLSLRTVEPPSFGSSVSGDARYLERPPVSLEQVVIKTENPRGIICYRTVSLSFMVHRPDVIFSDSVNDADSWGQILVPGTVWAMEYGWRASAGVKNGLLNGEGYVNLQEKPPVVVPALSRIRFTVANYGFTVQPDGQIAVQVAAFEDGEFNLRKAVPGLAAALSGDETRQADDRARAKQDRIQQEPVTIDPYSDDGRKVVAELQRQVMIELGGFAGTDGRPPGMVTFDDVLAVVVSDVLTLAYTSLGYDAPQLWLGRFNSRAGRTAKRYGGLQLSDRSIGDFLVPLSDIERRLGAALKDGEQLTFYNFVNGLLYLLRDPRAWDASLSKQSSDGSKLQALPEVAMRSVINGKSVAVYVFDVKREHVRFVPDDRLFGAELRRTLGMVTRADVRRKLRERGVPMVSFFKGNSYLVGAEFEAVGDEQIKTIFMRRYLRPTRQETVDQTTVSLRDGTSIDPRQLLYSSAIQGEMTMLGNFAFDPFALVWLDFGVPVWDGPFFIKSKEDTISATEFTSRFEVYSSGDDPLGTQGRADVLRAKQEIADQKKVAATRPSRRR